MFQANWSVIQIIQNFKNNNLPFKPIYITLPDKRKTMSCTIFKLILIRQTTQYLIYHMHIHTYRCTYMKIPQILKYFGRFRQLICYQGQRKQNQEQLDTSILRCISCIAAYECWKVIRNTHTLQSPKGIHTKCIGDSYG